MKKRKNFRRLLAAVLALALLALPSLSSSVFAASGDLESRQEELNQRKKDLEQQSKDLDQKLRNVRSKQEEKEEYKKTLEEKISVVQQQISVAGKRIEQLDGEINDATTKISEKQTEIEGNYDLLKKRLCNIYMAGDTSTLDIILGAKSMRDFLDKADMIQAISRRDKDLINELNTQVQDIQQQRDEIAQKRDEVADEKTQLDVKKAELADLKAENDQILLNLKQDESKTQDQQQSVDAEMDQYMQDFMQWQKDNEEELRRAASEAAQSSSSTPSSSSKPNGNGNGGGSTSSKPSDNGSSSSGSSSSGSSSSGTSSEKPPSNGLYAWPAPGHTVITSYYGNRPELGYHKGIDIAGGNMFRAPLVSVEDGVVTKVNRTDEWGSGWGYHIIIRHPDGNSTLYAHCDEIVGGLSVGTQVKRGQQIAYAGNTGQSYGAHLHFEVWKNSDYNQRVDPLPYLRG